MSGWKTGETADLFDPITNKFVGVKNLDGTEALVPTLATDPLTGGNNLVGPLSTLKLAAGVTDLSAGVGGGLPAYLGQVATRCFYNTRKDAGNLQSMEKTFFFMTEDISLSNPLYLRYDDKFGSTEAASGAATTMELAIEYPSGTYTRVTFGGSNTGVMPSGGSIFPDGIPVSIPKYARFWLRLWRSNPNGVITSDYHPSTQLAYNEAVQVGTTVPNVVMGGAITNNGYFHCTPTAMFAWTKNSSFLLPGDSRMVGVQDGPATNVTGDSGEVARSLGGSFGYICTGINGESMANYIGGNGTFRQSLKQYVSHVGTNYGINDLSGLANLATMQSRYATLWTALGYPAKPVYQCTLPPESSGTWADLAGQTPMAWDSVRVAVNDWIRGQGDTSLTGIWEVSDAVESVRDSGVWKAGYTSDGVHENVKGAYAIVSSGCINPAQIVRRG